jgi:hypothetical protein
MFKMTLAWLLLYVGAAVLSFVNPIFGLLGYLLEYHLRPSLHWWGAPLPDLRWNLMISIVLGVSFLLRRQSLPEIPALRNPAFKWLISLGLLMIPVTFIFAVSPDRSFEWMTRFWTYIVLYGLIIGVVRTRWSFDAFFFLSIAGATWWGWNAYVDPARSAGRLLAVGSSDTYSDNLAAAHLLTMIPMIVVYVLTARHALWKAANLVALVFIVNLFILCNSRGATFGLGVALLASVPLVRSGHRLRWSALALAAPVVLGLLLADPSFIQRQQTTANYEEDASATSRGFHELSPIYISSIVDAAGEQRSPHNTYALVASEWGVLGLGLFLAFIGSSWLVCARVRRLGVEHADSYFYYRGMALQIGLIGTMTAATFSDRFYGESIYWICALGVALARVQASEAAVATVSATETRRAA